MAALRHLAHMPIGYFNANPSGKLRKIIDENSFQTETFIAHQLPDLTGAQVTLIAGVCFMIILTGVLEFHLLSYMEWPFICKALSWERIVLSL